MPKQKKPDRVLQGLRRLDEARAPGQTFSCEEIASECGVTPQRIGQMADAALLRMRKKLRAVAREHGVKLDADNLSVSKILDACS